MKTITRFQAYQVERRYKKLFLFFSHLKKIIEIWQKPLEAVLEKKVFWEVYFYVGIWGVLDST